MRKTIIAICMLLVSLACVPASHAQNESPQPAAKPEVQIHFYRLKLVVEELDEAGKITNSRSYSTDASTNEESRPSIRAHSNVPYIRTVNSNGSKDVALYDAGTNFDIHGVKEVGGQLAFSISADISFFGSMVDVSGSSDQKIMYPYMRQNKWGATPLIPINKPTVIFTSDAVDGKGSMQVVATVTLIP
jgi:hypothetical protein